MKLHPKKDRIIVRRDTADDKSKGGILLPESAKERPHIGTVLAAGADAGYEAGNRVLFTEYAGTQLTLPDYGDVEFMRGDDVLALVED